MEVLSAIASLIAVGQALAAIPGVIDVFHAVAQSQQELLDLINDVEMLNLIGVVVRQTTDKLDDEAKAKLDISQDCITLIEQVKRNLASIIPQLESLARKCRQQGGQGNNQPKVSKLKWFQHKKQIVSLSKRARMSHEYLRTILELTSFSSSISRDKMLVDVYTVVTTYPCFQPQTSPRQFPGHPQYIGDASSHAINTINKHGVPEGNVSTNLRGYDQSNLQNVIEEAIRQPFSDGRTTEEPLLQLKATLRRDCARDCQCQCHSLPPRTRPHPAISPIRRWLDSAYNVIPRFGAQRCNVYTCQRANSPVYVNFRIPLWFCSRTLEASLSLNSVVGVGASLHLHVARIILPTNNIWWEIDGNKIEMVRLRLFRREISPIDHDSTSKPGYLIHRAMSAWQFEVVELLLREASSILFGTDIGKYLATIARDNLRRPHHSKHEKYILRKIIALDEDADDYWPLLHKTVREGGDLAAILEDSSEDINLIDRFGRAPLHHAVANNDVNAIQRLLSHGADPNMFTVYGDTPLTIAAQFDHFDCTYAMIDGGCDINKVQTGSTSAFESLIISRKEGSAEMMNFFLKNGVALPPDLNNRRSALHRLASFTMSAEIEEKFKLLVRAGIKLGVKDNRGKTPLDTAVCYNNVTVLRLLMGAGCKLNDTPETLNSLIMASLYCELESLGIFDEAEFTMDVRWRVENGYTALDAFKWRMNASLLPGKHQKPSDDDVEAFRNLLGNTRDRYLNAEIQTLELVVKHLREHSCTLAREALNHVIEEKVKWNIPAEYRTFRAVDVQIKEEMIEAAIESLEEFMEVSRSRIGTDPFVGNYCRRRGLKDRGLVVKNVN